jgi:hypothetical protein
MTFWVVTETSADILKPIYMLHFNNPILGLIIKETLISKDVGKI